MESSFSSIQSSRIFRNGRMTIFALLTLIGIVITFLPYQRTPTVESTEWIASEKQTADFQNQQLQLEKWQQTLSCCLANFISFYSFDLEPYPIKQLRFAAHFKKQFLQSHFRPLLSRHTSKNAKEEAADFLLS